MFKALKNTLCVAARERFVLPHYHAYVRRDRGPERRVELHSDLLDPEFVADPFLFRKNGSIWLFFEGLYRDRGCRGRTKGVIACLKLANGVWQDHGIVLEEPWHLSYPQVFEVDGRTYMVPESGQSGAVSLYESVNFPHGWVKRSDLIVGGCNYVDASLVREGNGYYLVVTPAEAPQRPELWMAESLMGPWTKHPQSDAVSASLALRRNGGTFLREGNRLYRIAQDCECGYGRRLFRVPVLRINRDDYAEGEPELLAEAIDWPQPLAHHTYNRLVTEEGVLEVMDRHYDTLRLPLALLVSAFWFVVDGMRFWMTRKGPSDHA